MIPLTTPPLADVIKADTTSVETAITSLMEFYDPAGGGGWFNYLRAQGGQNRLSRRTQT